MSSCSVKWGFQPHISSHSWDWRWQFWSALGRMFVRHGRIFPKCHLTTHPHRANEAVNRNRVRTLTSCGIHLHLSFACEFAAGLSEILMSNTTKMKMKLWVVIGWSVESWVWHRCTFTAKGKREVTMAQLILHASSS